jgi:RNA polymerase sporulation-specific sigma factor
MKKYVREDRNIRINRDIIYLKSKIERARELIMQKNKREPTTFELSKYLEIDEKKVIEALEINAYTKSIDEPINVSGKEITIKDIVCEKESLEKLDLICIKEALSGLSDIERYLLNMRYFEGLTQMETASIMGMTQVQVSRMEKRILEKMKLILCS